MELNFMTGLGFLFAVVGIGLLANVKRYAKMYAEVSKGVYPLYLGGWMVLLFGLVITAWNTPVDWQTWIVEVLGWLSVLKGIVVFVAPGLALAITRIRTKRGMIVLSGLICLVVGILLLV